MTPLLTRTFKRSSLAQLRPTIEELKAAELAARERGDTDRAVVYCLTRLKRLRDERRAA